MRPSLRRTLVRQTKLRGRDGDSCGRRTGRDGHEHMSSPATLLRPRRGILPTAPPLTAERLFRRRVYLTWSLLFFNTLTYLQGYSFVHIPAFIGKGIAQAALPAALLCALSLNR